MSKREPRPHPLFQRPVSPKQISSSLTVDMISPPLSPSSGFDPNRMSPSILLALDYLAAKFLSMSVHARYVVARFNPLPIGHGSSLNIIPITPLDQELRPLFEKYTRRAARKFGLSPKWMTPIDLGDTRSSHWEYIIKRSLAQDDILFSHEGLTLFNIDHVYSLKLYLNALTRDNKSQHIPDHIYIDSCQYLLHQLMQETGGRPFTRGFFHCTYDHLHVRDDYLLYLARSYEAKYDSEAIVIFKTKVKNPRSKYFLNNRGSLQRQASVRRKPITPNSASDVTPITRGEWKVLMEQSLIRLRKGPFNEIKQI